MSTGFKWMALVVMVIGCMPVRIVDYQKKTETDLKKYKTYSFFSIDEPEKKGKYYAENAVLLKKAIDSEMSTLGYQIVDSEGDLLINIGITVEEKVQTRDTDFRTDGMRYMGQRNYHWESQEVEIDRYKEGTIAIDFIDGAKKELVWQGSVAGTVTDNRKKIEERITTAIGNLFKKFPK